MDRRSPAAVRLDLPTADIVLFSGAFPAEVADDYFTHLLEYTPWRQDRIQVFGKDHAMPRLTAWYGDFAYTYTGIANPPGPWSPQLLRIKALAEELAGETFSGVLLNLYRGGRDSVSWHSDDEHALGSEPTIASVSFGATRRFQLRRKGEHKMRAAIDLHHGDVLVMRGATQRLWQHQIPKTARTVSPRINLTFRRHVTAA